MFPNTNNLTWLKTFMSKSTFNVEKVATAFKLQKWIKQTFVQHIWLDFCDMDCLHQLILENCVSAAANAHMVSMVCVCLFYWALIKRAVVFFKDWVETFQYLHNGLQYVNEDFSSTLSYVTACFGESLASNVRRLVDANMKHSYILNRRNERETLHRLQSCHSRTTTWQTWDKSSRRQCIIVISKNPMC